MISIIIIVKNDKGIGDTLKTLIRIPKPEKTEIIVIDSSKRETLLDIKKKFPNIKWFYYENKTGKKITIPEQRNMGIKKSRGDIIVFIDASCVPNNNWLIELIKPIREEEEYVVAGEVNSLNNKSIHNWNLKEKYIDDCSTINFAFDKKIISSVGYFDEKFNYGSDVDFGWRIKDNGYKIRNNTKAIISHDWGNIKQEAKRAFRYGEARINLYKKHPDKINYLLKYNKDLFSVYSILFFFYILSVIPISFFWPYYSLFLLVPFIKNMGDNLLRKMIFDFFWGYGIIKRLFFSKEN